MAVAFVVFAAIAVAWVWAVLADVDLPFVNVVGGPGGGVSLLGPLAGIASGLAYCCGRLLLLRTPVGPGAVRDPVADGTDGGPLLGIESPADLRQIIGLTIGVLVLQAVWSTLWLRSFRYGPAEWLWRCLTWWRRAPIRGRATA